MLFDNLYSEDNKEAEKGFSEVYYSSRSHQDNEYQFCEFCNSARLFLYDRCTYCGNN